MKKARNQEVAELRPDYERSDFGVMARGKSAAPLAGESKPLKILADVARFMRESFPNAQDFPDREQPEDSQIRALKLDEGDKLIE